MNTLKTVLLTLAACAALLVALTIGYRFGIRHAVCNSIAWVEAPGCIELWLDGDIYEYYYCPA